MDFAAIRQILDTLADTPTDDTRDQVYGRHDAQGRFSWDDEASLLAAIADPRGTDVRLVPPLNFAPMSDDDIKQNCPLIGVLSRPPGPDLPPMPRLRPGTSRRIATADELQTIMAWLRGLPFPR